MYFPVGWPRVLKIPEQGQWDVHQITCNRDRIFFAILSGDVLQIWYNKPCVPVVFHRRSPESLEKFGTNVLAEWKPDSSMIVIATYEGHLLLYKLGVISDSKGLYVQTDSPHANLRRDSAELFIKEFIPPLNLTLSEEIMVWDGKITGIVCITMSEFMVSTTEGHVLRYKWDGTQHRDYNLDLRRIPFCINQQVSRAIPILEENTYIVNIEYSPLVGGFSIVLNDGRAAFLTASSLKFDPNQVQGIWAQGIEDATCTTMNHKYRLITFGRANSECIVYYVDETTGGLEISHNCLLSSKDYPGDPGAVNQVLWTPDGCALAVTWSKGGLALWSTFGALLMCSLGWDYGLNVDIEKSNPLKICSMEWAQEGYQLWMIRRENYEEEPEGETKNCQQKTNNFSSQKLLSRQHSQNLVESAGFVDNNKQLYSSSGSNNNCVRQNHTDILHNSMDNSGRDPARRTTLIQMDFVKSALTINPCQSHQSHLYLQGGDKLYVNSADTLIRMFSPNNNNNFVTKDDQQGALGGGGGTVFSNKNNIYESGGQDAQQQQQQQNMGAATTSTLSEGRQWLVIPIPSTYSATNWPIRYSAIDFEGLSMAVAGRTGLAHYSLQSRRWKLFGNETQEKDFIVAGGLMWWRDYVICGCYGIPESTEELRFYPRDAPRLDNKFARIVQVSSPILLMNILGDQLITFGSDAQVCIWALKQNDAAGDVEVSKIQAIDISALAVHPACIASVTLTSLRTETGLRGSVGGGLGGHHHQSNNNNNSTNSESIVLNVSGRLLMVQREIRNNNGERYTCLQPTVLASCVENVWVPSKRRADKAHLTEALWLFCGAHGMRVWLPLYPKDGDNKTHTFMSKRIMLPFHLKIYPLAILFEDAIILGAENDTVLYTSDSNSLFSLPFSVLQRTSQVYLHQILRQLIRRNLGYHAWEIARSCVSLPYFPHSLELLLHEVLEEEATSKEPIPDAQLPSVIEFIMEFPSVYLQTVVQCARKTEIALWPYLFSGAGKPKDLFQECMAKRQLETAASYLIILQNLETSLVSRQYATLLLNTALDRSKWELAKDLVRFLRAIDPNDVESPRNSFILPAKLGLTQQTPPVSPNAEDLSLILGNVQGPRVRSYSTTISPKIPDSTSSSKLLGTSVPNSNNNNNNNSSSNNNHGNNHNMVAESPQTNRKKSMPNTATGQQQENTRDNPNANGNQNHHNNSHNNNNNNNNGSGTSTAEEFFIDVILQKHARRLLQSKRLQDLGYFAAHLDFHLVRWLHKEIERAARVDDFVKALKLLHEDFAWPYPSLMMMPAATSSAISGSNNNNNGSNVDSLTESPQIDVEDRLKSLKIDVNNFNPNNNNNNIGNHNNHESSNSRIGDSGYMSFQGYSSLVAPFLYTDSQICETENDSSSLHSQQSDIENPCQNKSGNAVSRKNSKIYEKKVKLHAHHYNVHRNSMTGGVAGFPENSLNLGKIQIQDDSNMSLASSSTATWCGNIDINSGALDDLDLGESGGNTLHDWEVPPSQILEQLSSSGNKGTHRAEVQLRYLLQLFMEAGCLEWSLLISVLLRDAMAVVRTVNAAKSHDQTVESVYRLRQGLLFLQYWTSTECLGYKAFMLAVQNQISVLTKILETKKMQFHHHQQQQQQQQQNTMTFRNKNNNMAAAVMTSSTHHHYHQENQQYGVPQGSSIGAGGGGGLLMTSSLSRTRKISSSNSTTNHNTNSSIGAVSQDFSSNSSQIGQNPSQFFSLQNSTAAPANQHHRALKRSTSGGGDSGRSSNEVTSVASHKADVKKQNSTGVNNLRNHKSSGMQEENGGEEEEEEGMIPESTGCVIS